MAGGVFITFEGTEGTGKSTQAALLAEDLRREGRRVVVTREPGGTRLGEELRRILLGDGFDDLAPMAELFIYMADRAQHVAQVILPALDDGIQELFNTTAFLANDMIVMGAVVQFEYRAPTFEIVPFDEARGLKLGQDAIDRREPDVIAGFE